MTAPSSSGAVEGQALRGPAQWSELAAADPLSPGETCPPIVVYDTLNGTITRRSDAGGPIVASIHAVLAENSPTSIPH